MMYFSIMAAVIYITAFVIMIAAAVIDIRKGIIPDKLVIAGVSAGFILKLLAGENSLEDGLLGGMSAGLILLLIHHVTKGGLGLGDVKLFGCIGIYLGLEDTISAMLISAAASGMFSMVLILMDSNNKKREIPFAPFIMAGALAAVIFGEGL